LDGKVDFADLSALFQSYNQPQAGRTWNQGNTTGNGNFADLSALFQAYNKTYSGFSLTSAIDSGAAASSASPITSVGTQTSTGAVPEPTSLALLGLGAAALLTRRKRKA
jgi:hypothetical protein